MRKLPERLTPSRLYRPVFFLLPFLGGLYFDRQWCLACLLHGGLLAWQVWRGRRLFLPDTATLAAGAILAAGGIWNLLFGVDAGAGWEGCLWLLGCFLFVLLLAQWTPRERRALLELLPWMGCAMVLVSLAGLAWAPARTLWWENGRMAGGFQYANAFGAFAAAGLAVLGTGVRRARDLVRWGLLLAGLAASGSRGALLVFGLWIAWQGIHRRVSARCGVLLLTALLAGGVAAGMGGSLARLADPESYSTLWGRLLYWQDGLRLLAQHPLGVGRLGWLYLQGMVQTGVYHVRFVHSALLQAALDYGLPAALALLLWTAGRLHRGACAPAAAGILCLHACADADFAFQAMVLAALLALAPAENTGRAVRCRAPGLAAAALALLVLPTGAADLAGAAGRFDLAARLDPTDTEIAVEQMLAGTDLDQAAKQAGDILDRNAFQPAAWSILAEQAADRREYDTMAVALRQTVVLQRYSQQAYDTALAHLTAAWQDGWDPAAAARAMGWTLDYMDQTLEATSTLGRMIRDQPELEVPQTLRLQIRILEQAARTPG
ncbi:O-antigen ligase family protein [uncultured Gemmiger sp.]|uniref:O-antigen ligase family protein n=1 Tax=uncultured Gemmiger sp. TaxID=1623490 RepID=UPI0025F8DA3A|nr:O-antigen ligase family protein [uncultured Gemmiger sp.]